MALGKNMQSIPIWCDPVSLWGVKEKYYANRLFIEFEEKCLQADPKYMNYTWTALSTTF